jgi:hypothetical protein
LRPSIRETAQYISEISKSLSPQKPPVSTRRVWGKGSESTPSPSSLLTPEPPSPTASKKKAAKRVAVIGDLPDHPPAPTKESELNWEEIGKEVRRKSPNLPEGN